MDRARGEIAVLLAVAGANAAHRVLSPRQRLGSNLAAAALSVGLARRDGVSWSELGLGRRDVPSGLTWGALAAAGISATVAGLAALPQTRRRFVDDRVTSFEPAEAAFELGARIPLETALAEELLFRGALLALAGRRRPPLGAAVTTSLAFGLWHVLPTLATIAGSSTRGRPDGHRPRRAGAVVAAVSSTAVAGMGLARLRARSGSIVAPVLAHAALNMSVFAASRQVGRRSTLEEVS